MNPFRQKADGSLILVEERGDPGQRDRGRSASIIAQNFDRVCEAPGEGAELASWRVLRAHGELASWRSC
jgi:hypothetical protein